MSCTGRVDSARPSSRSTGPSVSLGVCPSTARWLSRAQSSTSPPRVVSDFRKRIRSWREDRGVEAGRLEQHLFVWPEAVNLFAGETHALVDAIDGRGIAPALIVIDTMARCMVGGDENSSKDVGLFIANLDGVARHYGAASLTVHHTGKNGELERGSSALRGASDTMASLKGDGSGLKLRCEKQKEWEPFDAWDLHLAKVGESRVIRPGKPLGRLSDAEHRILETVPSSFGTDWVSPSKVIDISGVPRTSVYRALNSLVDAKYMESRSVGEQRREYRITEAGIQLSQPSQTVPGDGSKPSHPPHHPWGGDGGGPENTEEPLRG